MTSIRRALVALMDMHAVNGGAACHWGGPAAFAEIVSSIHGIMFAVTGREWHEAYNFVNDAGHTENGIYALRANYFALFGEARVPLAFTGSAVGLVSIIGFTPDVFMGPLMGWLIDRSPGAAGHHHVFGLLALFSAAGLLATLLFRKLTRTPPLRVAVPDREPA